ncbi:16S rRNA (cytosine967-C5)-methyltransferase [Bacilli bacterium PM5-3]|nr:16S rRNA (cytosine967-C5)-methyltransferase [Bacilli bacterium PM5-3]MDH6603897.1 16S rRNA (cytosine967-C5)-methyltransferase [Bacilli bacterium PM5-9]
MNIDKNNTRYLAYEAVYEVMFEQGFSNLILQNNLNHLNDRDKGLVTKIVYGTIQNFDLLKYQLTQVEYKKMTNEQLVIILISLYQLHFLDKIPWYAIIDEALKVSNMVLDQYQSKFINAILSKLTKLELIYSDDTDEDIKLSINYSHPLWFIKMIKKQYGIKNLIKILKANNESATTHLRYNIMSNSYDEIIKDDFIKPSEFVESGLYYNDKNIAKYWAYEQGLVSVQDFSSQAVSLFMKPDKGMKVLDMCAAPGTKTTHLAELMNNEGVIKAYDIYDHKIELIKKQASRLHLDIIKAKCYDATQLSNIEDEESFDMILCDALCTGLGVIQRKPEIKYQDISTSMDYIIDVQERLLDEAYKLLKKGGTLVYSTCTVNKKENEKQIEKLLSKHSDLKLESEKMIYNFENGGDSFFMAKVIKS